MEEVAKVTQTPEVKGSEVYSLDEMFVKLTKGDYGVSEKQKENLGIYYTAVKAIADRNSGKISTGDLIQILKEERKLGHTKPAPKKILGKYYSKVVK